MRRRLLAFALALLPVHGSAAVLFAGPASHAHCTGDLCRCASHCPPKKPSSMPCHGTEEPLGALIQSAGCHAGQDAAGAPVSSRPQVTPQPFDLGPAFGTFTLASSAATGALPGFLHIDLPPPRPRA
jgi:hypothetical protein